MTLKKQDIQYIRHAKTILSQQFDKPITIKELAKKAGINETKLKDGFKELYAISIHNFVTKLRLEKAKLLLETTHIAITDISYLVGYSHVTHFTSLFKKNSGITPTEWRMKFGSTKS